MMGEGFGFLGWGGMYMREIGTIWGAGIEDPMLCLGLPRSPNPMVCLGLPVPPWL